MIATLPSTKDAGIVIIDDFHRLEEALRKEIADLLKVLADEESTTTKIIVVGINKAGDSLVSFSRDLANRIDIIRFEVNPEERVRELVERGEAALQIAIGTKNDIVREANGSFFIAQMLCHETCLYAGLTESSAAHRDIQVSVEVVTSKVMDNLSGKFGDIAASFAAGTKLRREGRAPYLHILKWLAEANEWSILLDRELATHPEQRGSVGQVVEKGYLTNLLNSDPVFASILHFEPATRILTVEDPQFVFFLRNTLWNKFAEQVGFINIEFKSRYDFALSFAGSDRPYADRIFNLLAEYELEVFYDKNEQHRILAENVEDYLGPIYRTEADFVICLLGPDYPKRIWTKFESDQFKKRFGERSVIPIWFTTAPPGMFDESTRFGGCTFDPKGDVDGQLAEIVETIRKKIHEKRVVAGPSD